MLGPLPLVTVVRIVDAFVLIGGIIGWIRCTWVRIPEALAYKGQPGKPAGMLVFDVELLDIPPAPPMGMGGPHGMSPMQQMQMQQQMQQQQQQQPQSQTH